MAAKPEAPKQESTAVAAPASTAVANWKERMAAIKSTAVENEAPVGGFISLKGGFMQYGDMVIPNNTLECVIVGSRFENAWYKNKYDPDKIVSPHCYAFADKEINLKPHEECEEPQHETCAGCPMNEFESDPDGGRGKWCRTTRRLVLLPTTALVDPATINAFEPVFLRLPVMSVDNFKNYVMKLATTMDLPTLGVVTEIAVRPHPKSLFQVHFKPVRPIESAEIMSALIAKHDKIDSYFKPYIKNSELDKQRNDGPKSSKY